MARIYDAQSVDATAFEAAKKLVGGLHFIAVQTRPEADEVAGCWLLRDREL